MLGLPILAANAQKKTTGNDTVPAKVVTPTIPSPITIQIPPKTEAEYQAERDSRAKEKVPLSTWFGFGLLIVATGSLCVGAWQVQLFRAQLNKMNETNLHATLQLNEMAKATYVANQQFELAQEQFLQSKRARVIVRAVTMYRAPVSHKAGGEQHEVISSTYDVHYYIVNCGDSAATITRCATCKKLLREPVRQFRSIEVSDVEGLKPDYTTDIDHESLTLQAGECYSLTSRSSFITPTMLEDALNPLYFVGEVEYRDETGVTRQTGFIRRVQQQDDGYQLVRVKDNEDYEYAD